MSIAIRTGECYPEAMPEFFKGLGIPPSPPRHEECPKGYVKKGLIGGWYCPCPCHREVQGPGAVSKVLPTNLEPGILSDQE